MDWLLVLSLKEGLVKCATVCVKSEVILFNVDVLLGYPTDTEYSNRELLMVFMFQCYLKITFLAYFNQKGQNSSLSNVCISKSVWMIHFSG